VPVRPPFRFVSRRLATALASLAVFVLVIDHALAMPLLGEAEAPVGLLAEPATGHLVVSEVMTGGSSASDEYIELYNPTAGSLPLDGLEVVYVTATGATVTRKAAWATGASSVPPGGHVLIANEAGTFAALADLQYANGLAASGGSVALRAQAATTAIDAVGWGTAANTWLEARPAPAPAAGSSLERLPGGPSGSTQDTDDNLVDFLIQPIPDPQNSASPPVPQPSASPSTSPMESASDSPSATPAPSDSGSPGATTSPAETATPEPPTTTPASSPSETPAPTPSDTPSPTPSPIPSSTPAPTPISIATARSMPDGSVVTVEGVTLTSSDFTDGGGYLADASDAIAVLLSDGTFGRGLLVRVTGTVDDRYAQRTIRSDATGLAVGGTVPEPSPIEIATGEVGEPIEGKLVRLSGTITGSATELSSGIAFDVDDGSGATRVLVGSATGIDTSAWERDGELSLIGVVGQRDSSGSGTAGFRVQPRDAADILAVLPAPTPSPTPTPDPSPSVTASPSSTPGGSASPAPSVTPAPSTPLLTIAEARAAGVGYRLRVRGVVTAPSGLLETGSAVVQDSTGAILIRLGDDAGSLALGQLMELDGTRSTKAGMLSLRVTRPVLRLGALADPDPLRRATGALGEAEEARLVITRGVVSTSVSKLGGGAISFVIDDGSGPIRVSISPRTGIAISSVVRGAWLELRGVLGQETTGKEPLRGYRIWPRTSGDFRVIAAPVAGAGGSSTCCASTEHDSQQRAADGLLEEDPGSGGAPASLVPAIAPVLARPHPTASPATVTTATEPSTDHSPGQPPRGAGLLVSGMGLAAVAAVLAWFGRRPRPAPADAEPGPPAIGPEAELSDGVPHLALVRADAGAPPEERRILPPTRRSTLKTKEQPPP